MSTREWINETVLRAREHQGAARDAFLDEACAAHPEHREEVEQLLQADAEADLALPTPDGPLGAWMGQRTERVGQSLAGCRLLRVIGEGGMGVVYEAEQQEPRRNVAVKLLRGALQRPEDLLRFRHEVRIVGRLRHPNIAQVFSAGTAEDGTPYLVMELIENAHDLREHAKSLTVRERVDLFAKVCDAVQYGHGQGVIHRDLKPSNILVGESGRPRLIDFGIARLVDDDSSATRADLTQTGAIFGTLAYLSPEQIRGGTRHADARSDVYALGVILYGILTGGRSPYGETLTDFDRAKRILDHPPEMQPIKGDLGMVVAKALRKSPSQRYASADALAADLRRYLERKPVTARAPSFLYQARLFAGRHRAAVAIGALAIVGLAATTVWSLVNASRAEDARILASQEAARTRGMLLESQKLVAFAVDDHARDLGRISGSLPMQVALADQVEDRMGNLVEHAANDVELRRLASRQYGQLARLNIDQLGRVDRARENIEQAAHILEGLEADGLEAEELAWQRAWLGEQEAKLLLGEGDREGAERLRREALTRLDFARSDEASDLLRAEIHTGLVPWLLSNNKDDEAAEHVATARKTATRYRGRESTKQEWALLRLRAARLEVHFTAPDDRAAVGRLTKDGQDALQDLAGLVGGQGAFSKSDAEFHTALSDLAARSGDWERAIALTDRAIQQFKLAAAHEPTDVRRKLARAKGHDRAMYVRVRAAQKLHPGSLPADAAGDPPATAAARAHLDDAITHGERALALFEQSRHLAPNDPRWPLAQVDTRLSLGGALVYRSRFADARMHASDAAKEAERLIEAAPKDFFRYYLRLRASSVRATSHYLEGMQQIEGAPDAARTSLEAAREAFRDAVAVMTRARDAGVEHRGIAIEQSRMQRASDGVSKRLEAPGD